MMGKRKKPILPDTRTIDIDDEYAVDFWARAFNVNHIKLKAAVLVAGTLATDVKRQLNKA